MATGRTSTLLLVVILLIVSGGVFVAADYFGLFGLRERTTADFLVFKVRTVDTDTGQRIDGVVVHCYQHGRQHACTQSQTGRYGEFRIMLPLEKVVLESLLFRHSEVFVPPSDPELRMMYIHPDYQRLTEYHDIRELIDQPDRIDKVELQRGRTE